MTEANDINNLKNNNREELEKFQIRYVHKLEKYTEFVCVDINSIRYKLHFDSR